VGKVSGAAGKVSGGTGRIGRLGKVRNGSEHIWEASGGMGKDGRASNKKAEGSGVKGVQRPGAQGPG
jgi:hypothetical protein